MGYDCQTVIDSLLDKTLDVYELLDNYISYIQSVKEGITTESIHTYVEAIRSYFAKYDIDIVSTKFKNRVELPKNHKIKEVAIDAEEIRKILSSCNNIRLKAWIAVLASSENRAKREACSIRYKDIDFSSGPTSILLRAQYTKTKTQRTVYISDEASRFLKEWIDFKQNHREYVNEEGKKVNKREITPENLVFKANDTDNNTESSIYNVYLAIHEEFGQLLDRIGLGERKETGVIDKKRRTITPNSFRRFVYGVVEDEVNPGYAEYLLGHASSTYHTEKEAKIRQTYKDKCIKYLQFLDFPTIQSVGKSFEAQMQEKDSQIGQLNSAVSYLENELEENTNDYKKGIKKLNEYVQFLEERLDRLYSSVGA